MNILIVITSDQRRGAELEASMLADELGADGHSIDLVALCASGSSPALDVAALGTSELGPRTLRALRRRSVSADVVVAFGGRTLPACALGLVGTSTPWIYRSIGDPAAWQTGAVRRVRTGFLMRRASLVVALWPAAADAIMALDRVGRDRVVVIPNARPRRSVAPPDPVTARVRFGIDPDASVVAVVGALSGEKRVDLAIDAVALLPDTVLLVVGDGPLRTQLAAHARRRLRDRVVFTGSITDVDVAYAAADVLALTSRTEGMPGVVLEADAAGLPVVAVAVGAVPWLVEQGLIGRVLNRDATAADVADGLRAVLDDPPGHDGSGGLRLNADTIRTSWIEAMRRVASLPCN